MERAHQRPHVDVVGPDWDVTIALDDLTVLVRSGRPPASVLRRADALPEEPAIPAITLAELAAGPHATDDEDERARRQDRLQRVEALLDPLPFDAPAARAHARVYAATRARQRVFDGRSFSGSGPYHRDVEIDRNAVQPSQALG